MITTVMGILNVTPDSFSDGGNCPDVSTALFRTEEMIREGAGIIDVGGESTRPGAVRVPMEEEIERVTPVIEAIKARFDIPVSVDTYKAGTAEAAIRAGASIVNDISGLRADPDLGRVVSKTGVIYVLTHNVPGADTVDENYVNRFCAEMKELTANALSFGIDPEKIILDPGIGFNKTQEENLALLRSIGELCKLSFRAGYPDKEKKDGADKEKNAGVFTPGWLLGVSRKSVIGYVLDLPVEERLEGTLALTVHAVLSGVRYIRVHDVKENVRAVRMAEALIPKR
ncbi:MAG: dihydropteroate synthase [Lachnospiraceae bacterium]|nr:dihydropteroate synthase [Lachnospiraceae bacterium]